MGNYSKQEGECSANKCTRPALVKGMCRAHYHQIWRGDSVQEIPPKTEKHKCAVTRCQRLTSKTLCAQHVKYRLSFTLTDEQIIAWFESDCACCGSNKNLVLDHDHSCCDGRRSCGNCVRGVLCRSCNLVLGIVKDNPETLQTMVTYIKKPIEKN